MSDPQVIVTARRGRDSWILQVQRCPFCGLPHQHGGGPATAPEPSFGHVLSHCSGGARGGYHLVPKTGTEG